MARIYNKYDRYIKRLNDAFTIIDNIEKQMEADIQELSNVDKELSDYMHAIEEEDLDKIKNPKSLLKKIKNARMHRREIKIITGVLHKFRQLSLKMNNEANRCMLISELHKEVKHQQQDYKYRIVDKEDII